MWGPAASEGGASGGTRGPRSDRPQGSLRRGIVPSRHRCNARCDPNRRVRMAVSVPTCPCAGPRPSDPRVVCHAMELMTQRARGVTSRGPASTTTDHRHTPQTVGNAIPDHTKWATPAFGATDLSCFGLDRTGGRTLCTGLWLKGVMPPPPLLGPRVCPQHRPQWFRTLGL